MILVGGHTAHVQVHTKAWDNIAPPGMAAEMLVAKVASAVPIGRPASAREIGAVRTIPSYAYLGKGECTGVI